MRAFRQFPLPPALLAAVLLAPGPLVAQSDAGETTDVLGRITTEGADAPIYGAVVRVEGSDRSAVTADDGTFMLRNIPLGRVTIVVEQLGYTGAVLTFEVTPDAEPLQVTLSPQPLVLDNLKVMVDRIRARRYAPGVAVTVLDAKAFENQPSDLYWALRLRGGLSLSSCRGAERDCVYSRGELVVPRVRIDDMPFTHRLEDLALYRTEDVYAVEIYQRGRVIHVYTRPFLNEVALSPRPVSSRAW